MRKELEELFLRLVRLYTLRTPIRRGRDRVRLFALGLCRGPHRDLPVELADGRRFLVDLTTGMQDTVYFRGEYEPVLTRIVSDVVREGDVCLDVGANFGWYTSLFRKLVGPSGQVHSFEPVPSIFNELERTVELAGKPANVFANNLALGDRDGSVALHLRSGLPTGHASISPGDSPSSLTAEARMVRLDDYLLEKKVQDIDIVKVDVEGAELMFLRGANRLFDQSDPPVILMEMALETSKPFGYLPDDLVKYISRKANYVFYAADEVRGSLRLIDGFAPDQIGANVFCVVRGSEREAAMRIYLET